MSRLGLRLRRSHIVGHSNSVIIAAWVLVIGGALICFGNLWLSLLQYPIHRLRGGRKESYKKITGWPFIGFLTVGGGICWAELGTGSIPEPVLIVAGSLAVLDCLLLMFGLI